MASSRAKGDEKKSQLALSYQAAKQVEEYIKVTKETSNTAYELACIAQDLGSLWPSQYKDEKSLGAEKMISDIVGDRHPYTFGKRGSDTIPEGLQALGQFFAEDPRHFGVRVSTLFTGGNMIQERRKATQMPVEQFFDSDDSSSESRSSGSRSEDSVSVSSEDLEHFDAEQWHQAVDALIKRIQSKKEWETMAKLREMYIFKDSERAADIVHVEALAELNDEELRGFEKTREELDTQVEAKQLDMLQTLSNFNGTLKKTTEEIIRRAKGRRRAKTFSIANMEEVHLLDEEEEDEEEKAKAAEAEKVKGSMAGELLQRIGDLQSSLGQLVGQSHQKKLTLETHSQALTYLRLAMEATEAGNEVPEPKEEIKELLRDWQKEGREKMEAEKKAEAEQRLKEVAAKPRQEDVSEDQLSKLDAEELKVMVARAEDDVHLLEAKIEELKQANLTRAKGGADRSQKALAAVKIQERHPREPELEREGSQSATERSVRLASRSASHGKSRPREAREPEELPHELLSKLEDQLPAAREALKEMEIYHQQYMASSQRVQQLREQFSLDPRILERRISNAQAQPPAPESPKSPQAARPKEVPKAKPKAKAKVEEPVKPPRPVRSEPTAEELARLEEFEKLGKELEDLRRQVDQLSQPFSEALGHGVVAEGLGEDVLRVLREEQVERQQQKQDRLRQLRSDLTRLRRAALRPALEPVGEVKVRSSGASERRKSKAATPVEELEKQIDPALWQQLIRAQGETYEIQEQLNVIEDLVKALHRGSELTEEQHEKLKELLGDVKDESAEAGLKGEKKKIRRLEKQVKEMKSEWIAMDPKVPSPKGITPQEKVRTFSAASVFDGVQGAGETAKAARRSAPHLATHVSDTRVEPDAPPGASQGIEHGSRSPIPSDAPRSQDSPVESVDDLLDMSDLPSRRPSLQGGDPTSSVDQLLAMRPPPRRVSQRGEGPRRRHSMGYGLNGMQEPMSLQTAVNRRRHSLAAGLRAAAQERELPLMIAGSSEAQQSHGMLDALNLSARRSS